MTDQLSKRYLHTGAAPASPCASIQAQAAPREYPAIESVAVPVEVDVRMRLMKTVAGNVVKDGVGACDALYSLATEHGADPQRAAGFAHHVNGALALLEDDVAKACELTAALARQLAKAKAEIERLDTECKDRIRQALENGQAAQAGRDDLAECFRLAGGDTECTATTEAQSRRAVDVVRDLRQCYDALLEQCNG